MGDLALAVTGAAVGFAIGGPTGAQIGWAVGSAAGSALFGPKGPTVEGPRLQDLQIQSSAEGAPIAQTYGSVRIAGNVIWGKPLSEHRHKEKSGGKGGGGGGATSITYTYTADFAIALCEGQINAVRKIWADGKLIYDVSEPTAAEQAIADGGGYLADRVSALQASLEKTVKGGGTMRIYTGSETQLPDPLIEADLGAGNAPAYRGTAYLVFDNLSLEDFGNRIPNITVEVVTGQAAPAYLGKQSVPLPSDISGIAHAEDSSQYVRADRALISGKRINDSGSLVSSIDPTFVYQSGSVAMGARITPINIGEGEARIFGDMDEPRIGLVDIGGTMLYVYEATTSGNVLAAVFRPSDTSQGFIGNSYPGAVFSREGATYLYHSGSKKLYRGIEAGYLSTGAAVSAEVLHIISSLVAGTIKALFVGRSEIYVVIDGAPLNLVILDLESGAEIRRISLTGYNNADCMLYSAEDGVVYILIQVNSNNQFALVEVSGDVVSKNYGTLASSFPLNVTATIPPAFAVDSGLLVLFAPSISANKGIHYFALSVVGSDTVPLSSIVSNICARAGLDSGDINVTDLADIPVRGYLRANQMTARSALEPLSQAYRFDATESDGVLKFVLRGTASVATLTVDDFALAGDQDGPHVTTLQQDNELPIELTVRYMDVDRDYQSGAQRARRLAPDSQQTVTIELPVVLHGDEAKQSAAVLQYLAWTERTKYQFALRPQHLKLDAGDVITAPIGGADRRLRLTQVTLADVLACEAVADDASVYVSAAVAAATTSAQQTISTPGTTIPAFLDIPILRDADDDADFYLGAVGTGSGWTGAAVYKSADRADWSRIDAVTEPSTIGTCTTLLPTGPTTVFDDGSTVTVRLISGTLSSVTEAQMCNGANAAAIGSMAGGWEIVGFQNATLQGDGTYLLSRFLRGRRGTEWAVGTHAIGDQFVLLESGDLIRPNTASTEINSARYYRLPSFGTQLVDASEITYTHQAIGKKPLSPVHIGGRRHSPSTNDWTISWVRRGRLDWEWRDYVDTPLGEASESYEIDIMNGSTVKRTLTATSQSVTYTAAQQTTDFGAVQTTLSVRVYQISAAVGRGYAGTATL